MAELGKRAAGLSQHGAVHEKGSTDAPVSKIDKGEIFLCDAPVDLLCVGIAGGIVQKIHRIIRKGFLKRIQDLGTFHRGKADGGGVNFPVFFIDHGSNDHADSQDLIGSAVLQDGILETVPGGGNVSFSLFQLAGFLKDGSPRNVYQMGINPVLVPVENHNEMAVAADVELIGFPARCAGFAGSAIQNKISLNQFIN